MPAAMPALQKGGLNKTREQVHVALSSGVRLAAFSVNRLFSCPAQRAEHPRLCLCGLLRHALNRFVSYSPVLQGRAGRTTGRASYSAEVPAWCLSCATIRMNFFRGRRLVLHEAPEHIGPPT